MSNMIEEEITASDAFNLISNGLAYGIDVREQFEWEAGHWDKFISNPLSSFDLSIIPTDKPVIFVCRSGNRSSQVCESLINTGIQVSNLVGGMKSWQTSNLPITSVSGEPKIA